MSVRDEPQSCACGFEASTVSTANAERLLRDLASRYEAALSTEDAAGLIDGRLRRRPSPDTWSALEYACHVRDVIALWGWALHHTLNETFPQLPAVEADLPDRVAAENDYNGQDPAAVTSQLSANAERMAGKVATMRPEQWGRSARFGDVDIDPLWIVRKVAHEGHHHLGDIQRCLEP